MSDRMDSDPFSEGDPAAEERERRRREREQRRRARRQERAGEGTRRSLGERVRASAGGQDESPAPTAGPPAAPRQPVPAEPRQPDPAGGGAPKGPRAGDPAVLRRRLIAAAAIAAAVLAVLLIAAAVGGEEDEGGGEQAAAVPAPKTVSVTIPEGLAREQVAEIAKDAKLKGSYLKATRKAPKGFPIERYDGGGAPSLEGFLFPATYELEKGAKVEDLVAKQLAAFEENFSHVNLKAAKKKNLTPYDVITIASMIEREVAVAEERELVSAVIYNRLSDGEPLGIDATLRYEVGFDEPLTESQLQSPSPYNTRLNGGLPPTPIGNPGLASLEAAAAPAKVDYRYYVFEAGSCNEHFFTADFDEFNQAQAEYQAALEREGGQPSDCG